MLCVRNASLLGAYLHATNRAARGEAEAKEEEERKEEEEEEEEEKKR